MLEIFPVAFGPRIDSERKSPFFPDNPRKLITEKRFYSVPFITGVTQNEGILIHESNDLSCSNNFEKTYSEFAVLLGHDGELMKKFNENPLKHMRYLLNMDFRKNGEEVVKKVLERYVNLGHPLEEQPNQMDKVVYSMPFR